MLIHPDFSKRAVVRPDQYRWIASPQAGVDRMMLDRLGGEQARATSIVRYAPGSHFPAHDHPGGEEILVLSGVFSEDGHDHPAGWYLRSPPGSSHRPSSAGGATIFVKLWQIAPGETGFVRIDSRDPGRWSTRGGRSVCLLHSDGFERVRIERVVAGEQLLRGRVGSAELLVLEGELVEVDERYPAGSWIRLPEGEYPAILAGGAGALCYVKVGHLGDPGSSTAC